MTDSSHDAQESVETPEGPDSTESPEVLPEPPDAADPLKRDHEESTEGHPGVDPVMRPVPKE